VQLLVYHQVDLNSQDHTQWMPLHYACFNDHSSVVEYLLQEGAEVNAQNEVSAGY
jgi:ankyrin repeat protein